MVEPKVLRIVVLFNTALLVGNRRVSAECSSWSVTMMEATLLEGCGL